MNALERAARKRLLARQKHRWLKACARFPPLRDSPSLLRLVILLWDSFNTEYGYAYPGQKTLADQLGTEPSNVSHMLTHLSEGDKRDPGLNIIGKVSLRDIDPEVLEAMRRIDPRGKAYTLNFEWAEGVLTGREFIPEPDNSDWIEAAE